MDYITPFSLATAGRIERIEPLSWWTGMHTPLQLLVKGPGIGMWSAEVVGGEGMRIAELHCADSPNYLFADVEIDPAAEPGIYTLRFFRGEESFEVPYELAVRRPGSRERTSFSAADMIYLVLPDRFSDGDPEIDSSPDTAEKADRTHPFGRHGGDLQGVIDHLDYIAELGATAVWCTPVLLDDEPRESYHGYACADYYRVDPRMGCNGLYRTFVSECHSRGLKAVMDVVTNHCGNAHWWMQDLPFRDWVHRHPVYTQTNNLFSTNMDIHASRYDLEIQQSGWFDRTMPDMNLDNPFLLRYFQQWAVWWVEWADLDGLRVDTYPYNEKGPMSAWCASVRSEYPALNIVGECWTGNIPQLAYWQGGKANYDGFDSHLPAIMDFPLHDAVCAALPTDSRRFGEGMMRIYNCLSNDFVYHDLSNLLIFLGNHDVERIADILSGDIGRLKIAMTLLATLRGIPQLFAGDELGFVSTDRRQGHGGLRRDFPGGWQGDALDLFDSARRQGAAAELHEYVRRLFNWRKGKRVLHTGRMMHFAPTENTYAYFRYDDTQAVLVFINNSRGSKKVPWNHYAEITGDIYNGRNAVTGAPVEIGDTVRVEARSAWIVEFDRDKRVSV